MWAAQDSFWCLINTDKDLLSRSGSVDRTLRMWAGGAGSDSSWAGTSQECYCVAWIKIYSSATQRWGTSVRVWLRLSLFLLLFVIWSEATLWQLEADVSLSTDTLPRRAYSTSVLRKKEAQRRVSAVIVCKPTSRRSYESWRVKPDLLIHILLSVRSQVDLRPTCHPAWPSHPFCVCRGLSGFGLNPQRQGSLFDVQGRVCS